MATGDITFNMATIEIYGRAVLDIINKVDSIRGVEPTPIYDTLVEEFWPKRWIDVNITGEVRFLDESLH